MSKNKLSWFVYCENPTGTSIESKDIFKGGYWEREARLIYEKVKGNRKEWEETFRLRLMSRYWARAEYEIVLCTWPCTIETDRFEKYISEYVDDVKKRNGDKPYRVSISPDASNKIDIYEQLQLNWDVFINYVWRYITDESN